MNKTLVHYLSPISDLLSNDKVTEICITENLVFSELENVWEKRTVNEFSADILTNIANLIATDSKQSITAEKPILSAYLETGERIQIVIPPGALKHSITIRKPSLVNFSLEELEAQGAFDEAILASDNNISSTCEKLLKLISQRDFTSFFKLAIEKKYNMVISGATGSGKTTFMKSLIQYIPIDERLITIEDVPELILPHENHVRLLYSKGDQSISKVTPKMQLESCLRMRPDRILLAELRGEEAFYYVRNVNSGHPGSITSIHANSPKMAFDQLMLYIKESESGRNLDRQDIDTLLHLLVDIVVQFGRDTTGKRKVTEIYFNPHKKAQLMQLKNK